MPIFALLEEVEPNGLYIALRSLTRSLGHVISFAGSAQEAGAGGRWRAAGSPVQKEIT